MGVGRKAFRSWMLAHAKYKPTESAFQPSARGTARVGQGGTGVGRGFRGGRGGQCPVKRVAPSRYAQGSTPGKVIRGNACCHPYAPMPFSTANTMPP